MKRKKQRRFEETKGEKFKNWIKEKRFYIVLLCCIMAVSATYFAADSLQRSKAPSRSKLETTQSPRSSSTPLPDLTHGIPEDDKSANLPLNTPPPKAAQKTPVSEAEKNANSASVKPSEASAVGVSANTEYTPPEKSKLSYPVIGELITPHATETLIYSKTLGDWRSHEGIDIKAQIGTDVLCAAAGVIEDVYTDNFMGITIVVNHQNGLRTVYSNLSNSSLVSKGQSVERGNIISAVGDSAICETGEVGHLHFEVYEGEKNIDPLLWLEKQ